MIPEISDAVEVAVREHFLGWQCRIRQISMRQHGGRPTDGMRPRVLLPEGQLVADALTTVLVPADAEESTAFFRHQVRKTHDPKDIYSKTLPFLQSAYYQHPTRFRDELTALFGEESVVADALLAKEHCVLEFDQFSQFYRLACSVRRLAEDDEAFEATYWHNRIFNPYIPAGVQILAFQPDWRSAHANPAP